MIDSEQLCEEFIELNKDELGKKHTNYNNQILYNNIYAIVGFVFIGVIIVLLIMRIMNVPLIIILGALGSFMIFKSINSNVNSLMNQKRYEEEYVSKISTFIINKYFDDSECYDGIAFNSKSKYDDANYDEDADKILDLRHLSIKYKDYKINVMNIIAARQDIIDIDEETDKVQTSVDLVFEGLFIEFKLKKKTGARIGLTDPLGKHKMNNCDELLEMDYSKFEKEFDVYTNNKQKAMELLTVDVLVKLEEIHRNSKTGFDILIDDDTVYIRIPYSKKMFEMGYDLVNRDAVKRDNEIIYLLKEIVEALTLNDL